jgi:hypothetical protein
VRCGATGNALDDHPGSVLSAVEDCDASARGEALYDEPFRERYMRAVSEDEMVRMLLFEDADHDHRRHHVGPVSCCPPETVYWTLVLVAPFLYRPPLELPGREAPNVDVILV